MSNKPTKHLRIILTLAALLGAAEASVDLKPLLKVLKNYTFSSVNSATLPEVLQFNLKLTNALSRQKAHFDELTIDEHRDLYQATQLTKAYFESLESFAYLDTKVSSREDIETNFKSRIPTAMYLTRLNEVQAQTHKRYATIESLEADLDKIKRLNENVMRPNAANFTPQISEEDFISRTKSWIAIQNQFLIRAFAKKYEGRKDVSTLAQFKEELSVCFRNEYVNARTEKLFNDYVRKTPNNDQLTSYKFIDTLNHRVDELQRAAKAFALSNTPEKYIDYVESYEALLNDKKLNLIVSTKAFLSWLGPIKNQNQLKKDVFHLKPKTNGQDWSAQKSNSTLETILQKHAQEDAALVAVMIERSAWKAEMKESCEEVTRATKMHELLDWPMAVSLMIKRDKGSISRMPAAIKIHYEDIQNKEKRQRFVQNATIGIGVLMIASGVASYYTPAFITYIGLAALNAATVWDVYETYQILKWTQSSEARVNAALIAQLADSTSRKESFVLVDKINVLKQTLAISIGFSIAFDGHAMIKGVIKGAKGSSTSIRQKLNQLKDYFANLGKKTEKEAADLVLTEEKVIEEVLGETTDEVVEVIEVQADEAAEVATGVVGSAASSVTRVPPQKPLTMVQWMNLMNPKNILKAVYQQPKITPRARTQMSLIQKKTQSNLSFMGAPEMQTFEKRSKKQIMERLGLIKKAGEESEYVGLHYREINLPANAVVLEVGPGTNPIAKDVAEQLGVNEYFMVDAMPLKEVITSAEGKAMRELAKSNRLAFGLAQDLPIKDQSIDLFLSHGTFFHLSNLGENISMYNALTEAYRVLKSGGEARIHIGVYNLKESDISEVNAFISRFGATFSSGVENFAKRIDYAWEGDCLWFRRLP